MKIIQKVVFGTLGTGISHPRAMEKGGIIKSSMKTCTLIGSNESVPSVPDEKRWILDPSGAPIHPAADRERVPDVCFACGNRTAEGQCTAYNKPAADVRHCEPKDPRTY